MEIKEIIEQAKFYFGKNRRRLKKKILSFELDGKEYRAWKIRLKHLTSKPFDVSYGAFDDVIQWLKEKNYSEIDWRWLGDLSWEFKFLLNPGVAKGFDWDRKLALKCGGTARIAQVYVSDIVPCFVIDVYYMTYSRKNNYWEFGPIQNPSIEERRFVAKAKRFFQNAGFTFLSEKTALQRYAELYSDCNSDGNATLFDALFSDTENYQKEIKRFNHKALKDPFGRTIHWNEYYDRDNKLKKREEYTFYDSGNVTCVVTDGAGQIIEVKVWRDIDRQKHLEFVLDVFKEHAKRKKRQKEVNCN
jgi:hypothetical protein